MADAFPVGSQERSKAFEVFAGTDRTVELAKKYKIKTAFDVVDGARSRHRSAIG
jgi:hypothetical protein